MSCESKRQISIIRSLTMQICEQIAILRLRAISSGDTTLEKDLSNVAVDFRSHTESQIKIIENFKIDNY